MKARTSKEIREEAEQAYIKQNYDIVKDVIYTAAVQAAAIALTVMVRRGRSKQYIKSLFNDLCFMYDYPEFKGKRIEMTDVIKMLEQDYDIDFGKIVIHLESENEFAKGVKRNGK